MNLIKKNVMTEREYRLLDRVSYSGLKIFDNSYRAFYKQFLLGEKQPEEFNLSMLLGNICDTILTDGNFDEKYSIISMNKPTGQMGDLCENLYLHTKKYINESGEVTQDFSVIFQESVEKCQKDGKFSNKSLEKVLDLFRTPDKKTKISGEEYYSEMRKNHGKVSIDLGTATLAEKIVQSLREGEYTRDIINQESDTYTEIHSQVPILFEISKLPFKSLLDKLKIDHRNKVIQPYDLKISYTVQGFPFNYWKNKYYIQLSCYHEALKYWIENERTDLKEYIINPMIFITGDSTLSSIPCLWKCTEKNLNEGYWGFQLPSGKKQRGVIQLVNELNWHINNAIWDRDFETFNNQGIMEIPAFETE